ncbi:hypothetical protein QTN25_001425 [Entamoeba marina]
MSGEPQKVKLSSAESKKISTENQYLTTLVLCYYLITQLNFEIHFGNNQRRICNKNNEGSLRIFPINKIVTKSNQGDIDICAKKREWEEKEANMRKESASEKDSAPKNKSCTNDKTRYFRRYVQQQLLVKLKENGYEFTKQLNRPNKVEGPNGILETCSVKEITFPNGNGCYSMSDLIKTIGKSFHTKLCECFGDPKQQSQIVNRELLAYGFQFPHIFGCPVNTDDIKQSPIQNNCENWQLSQFCQEQYEYTKSIMNSDFIQNQGENFIIYASQIPGTIFNSTCIETMLNDTNELKEYSYEDDLNFRNKTSSSQIVHPSDSQQ